MARTTQQLRSEVREDRTLRLSLVETEISEPADHEVLVQVEATPINPSDLGLLFGAADMTTARFSGTADAPVVEADISDAGMRMMAGRVGQSLPVGNEGAGTVIAAGASEEAQALLGKTVGLFGGELYAGLRCVPAAMCLPLKEGTPAEQGASCFVNPMTALGMTETMRLEGHKALIHTAAASNLGQMLNRICIDDGIDLVNVVRKPEQETLLRDLGARYVVNSQADSFAADICEALRATGATLAFDAIGGGRLVSDLFSSMERVAAEAMDNYSRYGSTSFKQVYIYGSLDFAPTTLQRNFGFAWSLSGWLLPNFLARAGAETVSRMRARVASEIATTFASHYSGRIRLAEALTPEALAVYSRQATGEKFLIEPQR